VTVRNLDALLQPEHVLVLGVPTAEGPRQLFHNIGHTLPTARRTLVAAVETGWSWVAADAPWPAANLAVMMDLALATPTVVARLADCGCRALLWPMADEVPAALFDAMRPTTLRLLGPRGGGVCASTLGYNLSLLPLSPQPGSVALIAQSQSVAAAAVDWAVGRNIGLSWLAITGGEADVDVADLLDRAALDPQTRAVALQLSRIRASRKFMSAARACARIKPVVVLQTQPLGAPHGDAPLRSAAFQRAGLVECTTLGGLFDAIAALGRLPLPADGRVAVVGNGAGACALAVDALQRQGLTTALLPPGSGRLLRAFAPQVRLAGGAVDLGHATPADTAEALRLLLALQGPDAVIYVHSPDARDSHEAVAQALVAAQLQPHLLTVWLGLQTALAARSVAALGGLATFPSADEAARALRYRRQHRLTRELLMQTPPPAATRATAPAAAALLDALPPVAELDAPQVERLVAAYGLPRAVSPAVLQIEFRAALDAELGLHLRIAPRLPGLQVREAIGFAPLDPLLARRMLTDAGLQAEGPAVIGAVLPGALVQLGQLLIDQPTLASLQLVLGVDAAGEVGLLTGSGAALRQPPLPPRQRLPLAPYPAQLQHRLTLGDGRVLVLRPVRAADEPQVIGLLQRLDPEEVRLRFFMLIRNFSHDMAARMTQVDYDRELSYVVLPAETPDRIVAMGTLVADPDAAQAEFAVLVHHDWTGRGIGRHLLDRLLELARERGIGVVHGDVLAENGPMLAVCRRLGFEQRRDPDDPSCMRVSIRVTAA